MTGKANNADSATVRLAREHNGVTRTAPICDSHRQRVMSLITAALSGTAAERPSLTIVGPGNCQDIDLSTLASVCSMIQLVDLDSDSVVSAIAASSPDLSESSGYPCDLRVISPFDFATPLATSQGEQFCGSGLSDIVESLARPLDRFDQKMAIERTDVIISTCVLSQILNAVVHVAGTEIAQTPTLLQAVRRSHIVRMIDSLIPGGTAILVSDFVSSDTLPALKGIDDTQLPSLINQALHRGNFFSGLHPGLIVQEFQRLSSDGNGLAPQVVPPWRWNLGPRTYAVFAVSIQKPF